MATAPLPATALDEIVRALTALDPAQLDHWYGPGAEPTQIAVGLHARILTEARTT
jgi:hypothetical protein